MKKRIIILLVLSCSFLLISQSVAAKRRVKVNTIMNAFFEYYQKGYDEETIQQKLKKIIDGKKRFKGNEWDEFLEKWQVIKESPIVPKEAFYKYGIGLFEVKKMIYNILTSIARDSYLEVGSSLET